MDSDHDHNAETAEQNVLFTSKKTLEILLIALLKAGIDILLKDKNVNKFCQVRL